MEQEQKAPGRQCFFKMTSLISSNLFIKFVQRSLLATLRVLQLGDVLEQRLLFFLYILQAYGEFSMLLVQSGDFSVGLIELRSQASHLGVQVQLHLRALRGTGLQLGLMETHSVR